MQPVAYKRLGNAQATWSVSRDQQLQTCERKYYFQYLSGARINSPDPVIRGIALLKKVKTVAMWRGDCVHWAIAQYLSSVKSGGPPGANKLAELLHGRIERDWQFSTQRRFRTQPGLVDQAGVALFEHEYDEMPPGIEPERVFEEASKMLSRFLLWAEGPGKLPEKITGADRIWIEPPMFGPDAPGFCCEEVQVLTKVDFAWERVDEEFAIYDWKSGRAQVKQGEALTQHEMQVGIYQLWPHLTLGHPLKSIASRLVYLGEEKAKEETFTLDETQASHVLRLAGDSIRQTKRWEQLFAEGEMNKDDLDFASHINQCRQCNFKRMCRDDVQSRDLL